MLSYNRTESVVEKLLANWLSLCMYRYLREEAGSSLYTLYQAIKVQVDKGPVDCITCEARYSLSEDRLLRTEKQLEYFVLVCLQSFVLLSRYHFLYLLVCMNMSKNSL